MRLILVRHGQTSSNVARLLDTADPGADLTALGHEQAAALPRALADERVEALYASTLARTQQTAAPLAQALGLDVHVRAGVREVRAGTLEMRGDDAAIRAYVDTVLRWADGDLAARLPGGEDGAEVLGRYDEVLAEVAGSGAGTAVVVSHGAVIRSWTAARAENVTTEWVARTSITNTGAVVLDGDPWVGWRALTWEGQALGGPALEAPGADGPVG